MYELIQISEHDFYVDCPAKIGIVKTGDRDVVLIDSGSDKDAAKKVLRHLDANGWDLKSIFNTHSHADHIGGNKFLQDRTGCTIYAPGMECAFTNFPVLEPACLYGGFPVEELRHKFLMAQQSNAFSLTDQVLPAGMQAVKLPGHCFDMVGFRTADGNLFLADCLSSEETLNKYGIGYIWDVESYLNTLEYVKTLDADKFIPSHAAVTEDIVPLAQYNIDSVRSTADRIVNLCKEEICVDNLLRSVFTEFGLLMTVQQHALIGSTVRSYLSYLKKQGRVQFFIEDNRMLWKASE